MARYGFSGTPEDTKILILHILSECPEPMPREDLRDMVMLDENADYFIYSDALADLIDRGLVLVDESDCLSATETARGHADVTSTELPISLRRQLAMELRDLRRRLRRDQAIGARLEPDKLGYTAVLTWSDMHAPLIELRMAAGSEEQGKALLKGWRENAEDIYRSLLTQLLDPPK